MITYCLARTLKPNEIYTTKELYRIFNVTINTITDRRHFWKEFNTIVQTEKINNQQYRILSVSLPDNYICPDRASCSGNCREQGDICETLSRARNNTNDSKPKHRRNHCTKLSFIRAVETIWANDMKETNRQWYSRRDLFQVLYPTASSPNQDILDVFYIIVRNIKQSLRMKSIRIYTSYRLINEETKQTRLATKDEEYIIKNHFTHYSMFNQYQYYAALNKKLTDSQPPEEPTYKYSHQVFKIDSSDLETDNLDFTRLSECYDIVLTHLQKTISQSS